MALIEDPAFRLWVEKYAADQNLFFKDFANTFGKLIGMPSSLMPLQPLIADFLNNPFRARSR